MDEQYTRKAYLTDLSDKEYEKIEPLLPERKSNFNL